MFRNYFKARKRVCARGLLEASSFKYVSSGWKVLEQVVEAIQAVCCTKIIMHAVEEQVRGGADKRGGRWSAVGDLMFFNALSISITCTYI